MASASRDGTPGPRERAGRSTSSSAGGNPRVGDASPASPSRARQVRSRPRAARTGPTPPNPPRRPTARGLRSPTSRRARCAQQRPPGASPEFEIGGDGGASYTVDGVRLQAVLAQAGVASRRGAEELIAAGRVSVDGEIVIEQGLRIDPNTAVVRADGARVIIDEAKQYLRWNKPRGW